MADKRTHTFPTREEAFIEELGQEVTDTQLNDMIHAQEITDLWLENMTIAQAQTDQDLRLLALEMKEA